MSYPNGQPRVGLGFDAHRLAQDRKLVLGGVEIPCDRGLAGHSDGDVLLHAVIDAMLGALGLPDIGRRFPDTDEKYRDADSMELLRDVHREVSGAGYAVVNLDCVVICDEPKLGAHADGIRVRIADALGIQPGQVGLKAKTTEGTRLAIPGESIAAMVTVLLVRPSP